MNFTQLKSGTSVEGMPIEAFKTEGKAKDYVYLMAGTHGDEVEGVYVVNQLFDWLKHEFDIEIPMVVIPTLNPDGLRNGTRVNANGVDLNRNLDSGNWEATARDVKYNPGPHPCSEPENAFLVSLLDKYSPKFILSFHTWKPMLNYNGNGKEVADFLHQFNQYEVCDDIKGHPTPGSLGELGSSIYKIPVLTFECPELNDDLTLNSIWKENEEGLKALFKSGLI